MNILVITCFTGDKKLCYMTERMLGRIRECLGISGISYRVSVTRQGVEIPHSCGVLAEHLKSLDHNRGFAYGMNQAVEIVPRAHFRPDYVLCINNDIEMPHDDWFTHLLREARFTHITVPTTDKTSLHPYAKREESEAFFTDEMAAYAWLVPFNWCEWLRRTHGFWLFSEDFTPGYGEDNWTTILLRKQFGDKIFRVVPKAWIRHLKAQTAMQVEHDRRKTSKVLRDKIEKILTGRERVSPVLKKKLQWYMKVLKC